MRFDLRVFRPPPTLEGEWKIVWNFPRLKTATEKAEHNFDSWKTSSKFFFQCSMIFRRLFAGVSEPKMNKQTRYQKLSSMTFSFSSHSRVDFLVIRKNSLLEKFISDSHFSTDYRPLPPQGNVFPTQLSRHKHAYSITTITNQLLFKFFVFFKLLICFLRKNLLRKSFSLRLVITTSFPMTEKNSKEFFAQEKGKAHGKENRFSIRIFPLTAGTTLSLLFAAHTSGEGKCFCFRFVCWTWMEIFVGSCNNLGKKLSHIPSWSFWHSIFITILFFLLIPRRSRCVKREGRSLNEM